MRSPTPHWPAGPVLVTRALGGRMVRNASPMHTQTGGAAISLRRTHMPGLLFLFVGHSWQDSWPKTPLVIILVQGTEIPPWQPGTWALGRREIREWLPLCIKKLEGLQLVSQDPTFQDFCSSSTCILEIWGGQLDKGPLCQPFELGD